MSSDFLLIGILCAAALACIALLLRVARQARFPSSTAEPEWRFYAAMGIIVAAEVVAETFGPPNHRVSGAIVFVCLDAVTLGTRFLVMPALIHGAQRKGSRRDADRSENGGRT